MIVLSAGMPKSGTAWYFNLTNDLLVAAGYSDIRQIRERYRLQSVIRNQNGLIGRPNRYQLARLLVPHLLGERFVVKTHHYPTRGMRLLMSLQIMRPTYIYRDPRDAAVSALEHGERIRTAGQNHTFAELKSIEDVTRWLKHGPLKKWRQWIRRRDTLFVRYEDLLANPVGELERLAGFLSINISTELLSAIVARYEPASLDPELRKRLHYHKAVSGRFKQVLKPEHLELMRRELGEYVVEMGYRLD